MGPGEDESKLLRIYKYIEELNQYGGFGEVLTITKIIYAGNLCFRCKNLYNSCAIHIYDKNQKKCKWFKEKA